MAPAPEPLGHPHAQVKRASVERASIKRARQPGEKATLQLVAACLARQSGFARQHNAIGHHLQPQREAQADDGHRDGVVGGVGGAAPMSCPTLQSIFSVAIGKRFR